jgi:hypothetical protein
MTNPTPEDTEDCISKFLNKNLKKIYKSTYQEPKVDVEEVDDFPPIFTNNNFCNEEKVTPFLDREDLESHIKDGFLSLFLKEYPQEVQDKIREEIAKEKLMS